MGKDHRLFFCNRLYLFKLLATACGMWDLSSSNTERTHSPCTGRWYLNHQTTREVWRTRDSFKGAGTARMPGGRVLFSQKGVLLVGKFPESGGLKVRNWGRASVLHVLCPLGNSKEPALCIRPAEALPACWRGLETSATLRPSISTLPSWPTQSKAASLALPEWQVPRASAHLTSRWASLEILLV